MCYAFCLLQNLMHPPMYASLRSALTTHWLSGRLLVPLSVVSAFTWASKAQVPLKRGSQAGLPSTYWGIYVQIRSTLPPFTLISKMSSARASPHTLLPVGIWRNRTQVKTGINCSNLFKILSPPPTTPTTFFPFLQLPRWEMRPLSVLRLPTPRSSSPGYLSAGSATRLAHYIKGITGAVH